MCRIGSHADFKSQISDGGFVSVPDNQESSTRNLQSRGSIYLHVLTSSMLISVLGVGAMFAVRVQMRSCRLVQDSAAARACATSAIELGLLHIKNDSDWRTTWSSGTWMENQPLGSGTFTLTGTDPKDDDLADSAYDAVILTGIGACGQARHMAQVVLAPVVKPYEALSSCLQGAGFLQVHGGKKITAGGAPVCTNGLLDNDGTIEGSAEAQSTDHTGTITVWPPLVPGAIKSLPDANVITQYAAKGTAVAYAATLEKFVLGPGYSSLGTADANGLYVINTSNANLTIRKCRIYGTLVVLAGTGTVTVDDPVFLHNYRSDFPTLLVSGGLIIKNTSTTTQLSEASCLTNFNPSGVPYSGVTDTDRADTYPNEIRGLVHATGTLRLQQTAAIIGAVICNGEIHVEGTNTITYTPSLYSCPPKRYTYVESMKPSPTSWKQVVNLDATQMYAGSPSEEGTTPSGDSSTTTDKSTSKSSSTVKGVSQQ